MNNLTKNNNLIARVCDIQYVPLSAVSSVVRGTTNFKRRVIFNPGSTWLNLYHTPSSGKFTQSAEKSEAGTYYNIKLDLSFPGLDSDNTEDLYNADYTEMLLKVKLLSGEELLIGSKETPVRFTESFATENSGSVFSFSCKSLTKSLKYES